MLWLIGMTGSGKTTSGREVARRLGVAFIDTDEELERRWGPIQEQWTIDGEESFREREESLVAELAARRERAVVATGGGAVTSEGSRESMRTSGVVVWLRAAEARISDRLESAPRRPILEEKTVAALAGERQALYAGVAHHVVDTDTLSIEQVIEEVRALWRG